MLPEVEQYIEIMRRTEHESNIARENLRTEYIDVARGFGWTTVTDAQRARNKEYHDKYAELTERQYNGYAKAKEVLLASDDALVRFIAEVAMDDYPGQAETILRALPADLPALDAIARDHDWCNVWTNFVRSAVRKGVLTDDRTPRELLVAYLEHRADTYASVRSRILQLADAMVAEAKGETVTLPDASGDDDEDED